ncbi:MAG TPA: hypothetical protein VK797_03310 [Tepidisphaeraceae bacterium]|nr:hypothetical protein [Tepidisphaeraceae bacterium]
MIGRRFFTVVSGISLLLCVASVGLWVRSYWDYDACSYGWPDGEFFELSSMRGHICVEAGSSSLPITGVWSTSQKVEKGMIAPWVSTNPLGFRFRSVKTIIVPVSLPYGPSSSTSPASSSTSRSEMIVVPNCLIVVLTAILPAVWLRRRLSRLAFGVCPACSYNLTGNTSGVCPECGTPIPKAPADESPRPA